MSAGKGVLLVICLLFLPLKSALALNCYFGSSGGSVEKSEAIQPFAVPGTTGTARSIRYIMWLLIQLRILPMSWCRRIKSTPFPATTATDLL